jgi:excisionase family DNA binding protein
LVPTFSGVPEEHCDMKKKAPPSHAIGDARDAAAWMGISYSGVRRLIRSGRLPAAKIGGRVVVRLKDANALLDRSLIAPRDAGTSTSA